MNARRTAVMLVMRSQAESGRSTSPTWPVSDTVRSNSARNGGSRRDQPPAVNSDMRGFLLLHLVREQHVVDALLAGLERRPAHAAMVVFAAVQLGLDLS